MQVGDPLAPLGASTSQGTQNASRGELGKEDFLRLLTTQLNHQDPLNPMDNTEFVAQLAQFSGLEQLMNMGEGMNQLAMAQAVSNGTTMVGFIGKEVVYVGDGISHTEGATEQLAVDLERDAERVTITVHDAEGNLVRTIEAGAQKGGVRDVTWDGKDNNGNDVQSGEYTFKVSAEDKDGGRVESSTRIRGVVTGVTYESGFPELLIGGQRVPVGQVVEVLENRTDEPPQTDAVEQPEEPVYVDTDEGRQDA